MIKRDRVMYMPIFSEELENFFNSFDDQFNVKVQKKEKKEKKTEKIEESYGIDLLEEILRRQNLMLDKQLQLQQQIIGLSESVARIEALINRRKI